MRSRRRARRVAPGVDEELVAGLHALTDLHAVAGEDHLIGESPLLTEVVEDKSSEVHGYLLHSPAPGPTALDDVTVAARGLHHGFGVSPDELIQRCVESP